MTRIMRRYPRFCLLLVCALVAGVGSSQASGDGEVDEPKNWGALRGALYSEFAEVDPVGSPRQLEVVCSEVCIDFSHAGNGARLHHGDYVKTQWLDTYGMTVSVQSYDGGYTPDGMARIFDSTLYNTADPDLASPNRECPGGGPGVGAGGEPEASGANCDPQGNLLIIQESDKDDPDDNAYGGIITFTFDDVGKHVSRIGFVDLDSQDNILFLSQSSPSYPYVRRLIGLGDNSIQDELIDREDVRSLSIIATGSCGVREICFCIDDNDATSISSFTLIDADKNLDIFPLKDGAVLVLADLPSINIRANTVGPVGSVQFLIDGDPVRVESTGPYALGGDSDGDFNRWNPEMGHQKLTAIVFSEPGANGDVLGTLSVSFTISGTAAPPNPTKAPLAPATGKPTPIPTPAPTAIATEKPTLLPTRTPTKMPTKTPTFVPTQAPASPVAQPSASPSEDFSFRPSHVVPLSTPFPTVHPSPKPTPAPVTDAPVAPSHGSQLTGFMLVNADTNNDLGPLLDGAHLILSGLPHINIRADTSGKVGSVSFSIDGAFVRSESASPYALAGDNSGIYNSWEPSTTGPLMLTAQIFDEAGATGALVSILSVNFTVVGANDATPSPHDQPSSSPSLDMTSEPSVGSGPTARPTLLPTPFPSGDATLAPSMPAPTSVGKYPVLTAFVLVNTATNEDISPLAEGETLVLSDHAKISIRAETAVPVGSVKFFIDGLSVRVESLSPYALSGDSLGRFHPWVPTKSGPQKLTAIAYEQSGAEGAVMGMLSVNFVVRQTPLPTQSPTPQQSASPSAGTSAHPSSGPVRDPSEAPSDSSNQTPAPSSPAASPANSDSDCPYKKITWADFKGKPPTGTDEDAVIVSGIQYSSYSTDVPRKEADGIWLVDMKEISCSAYMDKTMSGVIAEKQTDTLLEHKQYLFDISQYWARQLDKALKAVQGHGVSQTEALKSVQKEVARVYGEILQKMEKMQSDYVKQTDRSRNSEKQKQWRAKINKLLTPPAPKSPKADSASSFMFPSGQVEKDSNGTLTLSNLVLHSFVNVTEIEDTYMESSKVKLPELVYGGLAMDDSSIPLFYPSDPKDALVALFSASDLATPVLTGQLRVLIGDGSSLRGWVEMVEVSSSAIVKSPYLEAVNTELFNGGGVLTVEMDIHGPTLPDYTKPFNAIGTIRIGIDYDREVDQIASSAPSFSPSMNPTTYDSIAPTVMMSSFPTLRQSVSPSSSPSESSSATPSALSSPSTAPSISSSASPSTAALMPTASPVVAPSSAPASEPSRAPDAGSSFTDEERKSPYRQLTWDDFLGPAPTTQAAYIYTGLQTSSFSMSAPKLVDGRFEVKMRQISAMSFMDKTMSGVRPSEKNDRLLQHEQNHFDITEYWARVLGAALQEVVASGITQIDAFNAFQAEVNIVFGEIETQWREMQSMYDTETANGTDDSKQREWEARIAVLFSQS